MSLTKNAALVERTIAQRLVRDIIRKRFQVSVWEGEAYSIKLSTNEAAIFEAMASTDSDRLVIHDMESKCVGWVWLIYGNDVDLISDHSDNAAMQAIIEPIYEWIEGKAD